MIWLWSQDKFDTLAALDSSSGRYELHSRAAMEATVPEKMSGWFSFLGGTFAALYKDGAGQMTLRIGDKTTPFSDDVAVAVTGSESDRLLVVTRAGVPIVRLRYACVQPIDPHAVSAFSSTEDFDFGIWLENLTKNTERMAVIQATWALP